MLGLEILVGDVAETAKREYDSYDYEAEEERRHAQAACYEADSQRFPRRAHLAPWNEFDRDAGSVTS